MLQRKITQATKQLFIVNERIVHISAASLIVRVKIKYKVCNHSPPHRKIFETPLPSAKLEKVTDSHENKKMISNSQNKLDTNERLICQKRV